MKELQDSSLPVIVATALASTMILMSGNGIAESTKKADTASTTDSQKTLPPPGPFVGTTSEMQVPEGSISNRSVAPMSAQAPTLGIDEKAEMPSAPNMPSLGETPHKIAVTTPPADLKNPDMPSPINEPVFNRMKPSFSISSESFTLNTGNAPVAPATTLQKPMAPVAPNMAITSNAHAPQAAMNRQFTGHSQPAPNSPQFIRQIQAPIHPQLQQHYPRMPMAPIGPAGSAQTQGARPDYGVNHANAGMNPALEYRYVPLPVIQSKYQYQRLPSNGSSALTMPGYYWVPQNNLGSKK